MRVKPLISASLAVGLWLNLSGLAAVHYMLGPEYAKALLAHVSHPIGVATLIRHVGVRAGFGVLSVLLAILLRPRFNHVARSSLVAAGFLFLAAYVPLSIMLNEFGILVGWRLWAALLWSAGEATVATLLGSYLYERLAS